MDNRPKFKGTPIFNPHHPRNFLNGGYVEPHEKMTRKQLSKDSILAILQPREIVIPVKYKGRPLAKQIKKYLIKNNIKLPNF
jgi:hypothetical protein